MAGASRWIAAAFSLALGAATAAQAESLSAGARGDALEARIAKLEARLEAANHKADLALDRGDGDTVAGAVGDRSFSSSPNSTARTPSVTSTWLASRS